ncbi:hypothetical protein GCM10027168_25430 [Streptomyces capparidis]
MSASRGVLTGDSLRVKVVVQRVRLGGEEYRVISPARPLRNAAIYQTGHSFDMYVDRADGHRVGALWLLAARSPRSLVHLPMRATAGIAPGTAYEDEEPLDLVLAHRAVQFRPSRWKRLRERLAAGNAPRELRTAGVPERDLAGGAEEIAYAAPSDPVRPNLLRQHIHARTLFLTGCSGAFRQAAAHIFAVTRDGPPAAAAERRLYISGACNYHVCRSLYHWSDLEAHDWEQIHVEFCPTWSR